MEESSNETLHPRPKNIFNIQKLPNNLIPKSSLFYLEMSLQLELDEYKVPIDELKPVIDNWFDETIDPDIPIDYRAVARYIAYCDKMWNSRAELRRTLYNLQNYVPTSLVDRLFELETIDKSIDKREESPTRECFIVLTHLLAQGYLPPPLSASSILSIFWQHDGGRIVLEIKKSQSSAAYCFQIGMHRLIELASEFIVICSGCAIPLGSEEPILEFAESYRSEEFSCGLCKRVRHFGYEMSTYESNMLKTAFDIKFPNTQAENEFLEKSDRMYAKIEYDRLTPKPLPLNEDGYPPLPA